MANYNAWIRTNYFTVTDVEKYEAVIAACTAEDTIEVIEEKQPDGSIKYGFLCSGCINGLPDGDENDTDLFYAALQELLPKGEAIIVTEIGFEKMCYLIGKCTVITQNDIQYASIDNIALDIARTMLGNPGYTTQMDY